MQNVSGIGTNMIKGAPETCCMAWLVSALWSQSATGLWTDGELLASIREEDCVFEVACGLPQTQSKLCTRWCTSATATGKGIKRHVWLVPSSSGSQPSDRQGSVVGAFVVGASVVGASVIRASVVGASVVGALVAGGP